VRQHLWTEPHHDGSPRYVSTPAPGLGEVVTLFLRVPSQSDVTRAVVRTMVDGEQVLVPASVDRRDHRDTWYRADLRVENVVQPYRWLLDGGRHGYQWLTGTGLHARDVTDASDFRLTTHAPPPEWARDAVVYQVFPDRFARSAERPLPDWAVPAQWEDPVLGAGPQRSRQIYGGDLDGVRAHLDHIASLGADTVYLTPFFPARSCHRYDATSFDSVDPLLGGDEALARLANDLHARGMRLIGDLTANHCGSGHDWFRAALADPAAPEAEFFFFNHHPDDYVGWFGFRTMPKFDHRSAELRRRLYGGPDSVVARWLGDSGLDGWRIDVGNMTGRLGALDLNHDVARAIRATMAAARPDSLLVAEHSFDASGDLAGDGWHGVMNYAGFTRPMWQWLRAAPDLPLEHGKYLGIPRLPGSAFAAAFREFVAAAPWRATAHAMNLVGSHDTWRIRTALGDGGRAVVALGLLATLPGIPMLWAGDEIGLEAWSGEDARSPFPWQAPETWDHATLAATRSLFGARRESVALRRGGLRWFVVDDDVLVFAREAPGETVLVQAARADHAPVRLPAAYLGSHLAGFAGTADVVADAVGLLTLPPGGPAVRMWRLG